MKILHTYCLNYNIGDYALGIGLKNLLRKYLKVDLIGNTNIQGREFNKYFINEVLNKRYDLLVIGGGGIIHGAHWPNGWFWLIEKKLIKEIKIPFIVYGVGYNYWDEEDKIPQRGIEHLKETIKHAKYFSVRNDGSQERLFINTGIKADVTPDPGFHINLNSRYQPPSVKRPYVVIQLANDKPGYRFVNKTYFEIFVKSMRRIIRKLSKTHFVVLAPHVYDDISLSIEVSKNIKNTMIWNFGYFAFDHIEEAISYYKYADFVLAMRGHGQIIPIAFNTPVISIENHPKHRGLMANLNLLSYNVKINDENFYENLSTLIEKIQSERNKLSKIYSSINDRIMSQTHLNFIKIKNKLAI